VSLPRGVIVTGGTGALGRAVVKQLLERGARVAVPWRDAGEWQGLRAAAGEGAPLFGARADFTSPGGARSFVEEAARELGVVDGAALVAGGWAGGARFDEAPEDEWERMLRTNLGTAAHVCRAMLPHLRRQGGSVVAVGSRAAEAGGAGMAAYAVSKVALHALVRVLAAENARDGVRFNAVLPGTVDTPVNRRAMPGADPAGWTSPEAVARVVLFLLSGEAAATNGALVPVDGPA
jgi:NAD(P)-dependent dehydrogenase (short-subunit alcohol dehydrogenase family)